jgi:hypothetical protein
MRPVARRCDRPCQPSGPRGRRFKSCLPDLKGRESTLENVDSRPSSFTVRDAAAVVLQRRPAVDGVRAVAPGRRKACKHAITASRVHGKPRRAWSIANWLRKQRTPGIQRFAPVRGFVQRWESSGASSAEEGRGRRPGRSECSHRQLLRRLDEETERRGALRVTREVQEEPGHGGRVRFKHDLQPSAAQRLLHAWLEDVREPCA